MGKRPSHAQTAFHGEKHPHGRGEEMLVRDDIADAEETPPRAWGRLALIKSTDFLLRNTPTGVGKSRQFLKRSSRRQKHPHGRGEETLTCSNGVSW